MNSQLMQDSVAASSILDSITADNFAVMQPKVEASLNAVEDTIKQFMQEIANKNKSKRDSIEKRVSSFFLFHFYEVQMADKIPFLGCHNCF